MNGPDDTNKPRSEQLFSYCVKLVEEHGHEALAEYFQFLGNHARSADELLLICIDNDEMLMEVGIRMNDPGLIRLAHNNMRILLAGTCGRLAAAKENKENFNKGKGDDYRVIVNSVAAYRRDNGETSAKAMAGAIKDVAAMRGVSENAVRESINRFFNSKILDVSIDRYMRLFDAYLPDD